MGSSSSGSWPLDPKPKLEGLDPETELFWGACSPRVEVRTPVVVVGSSLRGRRTWRDLRGEVILEGIHEVTRNRGDRVASGTLVHNLTFIAASTIERKGDVLLSI